MTRRPPILSVFPYTTLVRSDAGADVDICEGESVQLNAKGSGVFSWDNEETLDDPFSQTPIATPAVTTTYTLTLSGTGACSGTDDVRSEEHTSELQSRLQLVCRLLLDKKKHPNRYSPTQLLQDRTTEALDPRSQRLTSHQTASTHV